MRRVRKPIQLFTTINASPFVALMFVLAFTVLFSHDMNVCFMTGQSWLPRASSAVAEPGALREDALLVSVTRDGKVFWGPDPVSIDQLEQSMRAGIKSGAPRKLYVRADRASGYHVVAQIVDSARSAGIQQIAFLTESQGIARRFK